MALMSVKGEVQQIANTISEILSVDVVIVDAQLQRIADTFHYPDNVVPIRSSSIIGRIIESGRPLVVDNKYYYQSCVDCKDRALCNMTGFMGVPIFYNKELVGAIGLVIAENNVQRLIQNVNLILGFLQQMADFLQGKIAAKADYESVKTLSLERDSMLEASDAGVVLVDAEGNIITYNQRFLNWFELDEDVCGEKLLDCLYHPLLAAAISSRSILPGQQVAIPLQTQVFYGKLSGNPMWRDGVFCGMAFAFLCLNNESEESISPDVSASVREILGELCSSADSRQAIKLLETDISKNGPLLLSGTSRSNMLELAAAIHKESGRSGKFIAVDTLGYSDEDAEKRIFGAPAEKGSFYSLYSPCAMLLAHYGTLCINNVFMLPVFLQIRLRQYLLQNDPSDSPHPDVRMIFTTSPATEPEDHRFIDEDLYQLLQSRNIHLSSPIESRKGFAGYLDKCLAFFSKRYGNSGMYFEDGVVPLMMDAYPWSQDVRQVRQAVEYLVRTCTGDMITEEQVLHLIGETEPPSKRSIQEIEEHEIKRLFQQGYPPDEIANILKISRSTLYRRIKKYKISL